MSFLGSVVSFFRKGLTSVCFQTSGKVAMVMEALKRVVSLLLIFLLPRLKMWCG